MGKGWEGCLAGQCDLQITELTEINLHQYLICKGNTLKDRTEGQRVLPCFILTKKLLCASKTKSSDLVERPHSLPSQKR